MCGLYPADPHTKFRPASVYLDLQSFGGGDPSSKLWGIESAICFRAEVFTSDVELIRFGKSARYMCSPWAIMNKPPGAEFQIQLDEAKAEWKRRHPKNTEQGNIEA